MLYWKMVVMAVNGVVCAVNAIKFYDK